MGKNLDGYAKYFCIQWNEHSKSILVISLAKFLFALIRNYIMIALNLYV